MIAWGWGSVMGRSCAFFDTSIGRCGIVWGEAGGVGGHRPEPRDEEPRRRLYRIYPEAREQLPPVMIDIAIEGITADLRGQTYDLSDVALDMTGINVFNQRVYEYTRAIPRGE